MAVNWTLIDPQGLALALSQAKKSYDEGGIPIGSAILLPNSERETGYDVLGCGHNQRIQKSSPILHAEITALDNAGRLKAQVYKTATLYTTLSPCSMCAGAILFFKIPRVVVGENATLLGYEDLLRTKGVEVIVKGDEECRRLMQKFIHEKPEEWDEQPCEFQTVLGQPSILD